MPTLIERDAAEFDGALDEPLVVDADTFGRATGWELKPEGLCRGEACVPVSGTEMLVDGRIDVSAFADRLGLALVVDADRGVAAIGGDPMGRGQSTSLAELTLPDVRGGQVDFGTFVGKKTLLVAWASW